MKMPYIIISVLMFALALSGLFSLKFVAEGKERQLRALQNQVQDDQRAIRVLKAEWAYLNRPDNIQELSVKYLGLSTVSSRHIYGGLQALPWRVANSKIDAPLVDFVMTPSLPSVHEVSNGEMEMVMFEAPIAKQPIDAISLLMASEVSLSEISLTGSRP